MITVALIGPDGVGKTTIAKRLEASFPLPIKYLYMGINSEASNYMLPTTRWWEKAKKKLNNTNSPRDHKIQPACQTAPLQSEVLIKSSASPKRIGRAIIKGFGLLNRILEEWYRQFIAFSFSRKGYIVIFDRHFIFDYYHHDIQSERKDTSVRHRIHGYLLRNLFPEPDLVICLDAPSEVVFKRKGEFTPEILELKRTQYLSLKNIIKNFTVVNANRDLESVVKEIKDLILLFSQNGSDNAKLH